MCASLFLHSLFLRSGPVLGLCLRTVAANRKTMPCAFPGPGTGRAGGPGRRVCQLGRFQAGRPRAFLMPGRYLCTPGFLFPEFNTITFTDVSSPASGRGLILSFVLSPVLYELKSLCGSQALDANGEASYKPASRHAMGSPSDGTSP